MTARRWLTGFGAFAGLLGAAFVQSCNSGDDLLRAKIIEERAELVGGPVAMADVGDFLLENDQIRVAILRAIDSPGPGVFGGSIVDIDRRRPRIEFQGGHGLDRFAESFPVANLMVPEPSEVDIRVLKDGSDGKEAIIRVEGAGEFLFEALGVLRTQQALLDSIFPNIRTRLRFTTDYILRPGARHIHMRTTLHLPDEQPESCDPLSCELDCEHGYAEAPDGCLTCACSDALPLEQYSAPESVFGNILGDPPSEPGAVKKAGMIAGDFVFFGNQNDVFAPGPGFDEVAATQRAFRSGRNTFQEPLIYDFVAAAGGDISYGYFTVAQPGGTDAPVVNVPLFASAATAFVIGGKNCLLDASDDDSCDQHRAYTFERYLAVGDGDVASVLEEVYRVRGTPVGSLDGHVYWHDTGEPVPNARLFVLSDPEPSRAWVDVDEVVERNLVETGDPGVVNAMDADLGLDKVEDGDFRAVLPAGDYVVVARDPDGVVTSAPLKVRVVPDQAATVTPTLPTPATILYRVSDAQGQPTPAKISLIDLNTDGSRQVGDARRRPYFGESRLSDGVRHIELTPDGTGEVAVEPGRYDILVSRGPEYGMHVERDVTLQSGKLHKLDAVLAHEIDSRGWMSVDTHLHSTPSFDSGMPIHRRVASVAAEGVELAVSTDHDVETDYMPTIRQMKLEPFVAHAIGAEITTLEQGHFIGFPVSYDHGIVPTHGAHDWSCQGAGDILDGIRSLGEGDFVPYTIVAHPRDGFFGYIDQLGVDPYTFTRSPPLLEADNPVFRTASCNFDAMELISSKRFDLTRTPTVAEVIDYNRCLARINAAGDADELAAACPELDDGILVACTPGQRYEVCQDRNRTELAWRTLKRILTRTPEEQARDWNWPGTAGDTEALCDLGALGDDPIPPDVRHQPCNYRSGQVDDYFRLIERGMRPTQMAASDSHGGLLEPGSPRTYFRSETDQPAQLRLGPAVDALRAGAAFASYGPFVTAEVAGRSYGETATLAAGSEAKLALEVQTASWFGVDRVEIYLNGAILRVIEPDVGPEVTVDVRGELPFIVPNRDSWLVIIAMGLDDDNIMSPVALSAPFGDTQLAIIAADAFSLLPVISAVFPRDPVVPDWSPIPAFAVTNPIYIDVDGNGQYDAPLGPPTFCSQPCDTPGEQGSCPPGQICLDPEAMCGVDIVGRACNRRVALDHGGG